MYYVLQSPLQETNNQKYGRPCGVEGACEKIFNTFTSSNGGLGYTKLLDQCINNKCWIHLAGFPKKWARPSVTPVEFSQMSSKITLIMSPGMSISHVQRPGLTIFTLGLAS